MAGKRKNQHLNLDAIKKILDELNWSYAGLEGASAGKRTIEGVMTGEAATLDTAKQIQKQLEEGLREKRHDPAFTLPLEELLLTDTPQTPPDPQSQKTPTDIASSEEERIRERWHLPLAAITIAALALLLAALVAFYPKRIPESDNSTTHIRQPKQGGRVDTNVDVCLSASDRATNKYIVVTANRVFYSFGPVPETCLRVNIGGPGDTGTEFDIFVAAPKTTMPTGEIIEQDIPPVRYPSIKVTRR